MNNGRIYKWEPGDEHAWIAEDAGGFLAYMTCSIDAALPDKVNIDARMMSGLDLRLKALFDFRHCKEQNWFESFSALGFFVYDAVRAEDGLFAFELMARPTVPITVNVLPLSLRAVAMCFSVGEVRFNNATSLPVRSLNGTTGSGAAQTLAAHAIGTIQRVSAPHVSVWECLGSRHNGEYMERGLLDLHAVMGFSDVKNKVATIFVWEMYADFFESLVKDFMHMKNVHRVCVQEQDKVWRDLNGEAGASGLFDSAPKSICLKACSGQRVAELVSIGLHSNAAHGEYCRYSIRCAKKEFGAIAEVVACAARKTKCTVEMCPKRNGWWLHF